jgi:hypothetical protein
MTEISLDTLMAAIGCPAHSPIVGDHQQHLFVAERPVPFVAPTFEMPNGNNSLDAEVVFVEASAAIGKTTIAKFMSAVLNVSILDLSKVPVATGSFKALIQELKGQNIATDSVSAFHAGRCPIIIDAMDEGRLLSGDTGIESFLETTAQFLESDRSVTSKAKLIIFGRFESIDLARTLIEIISPEVTLVTVQVGFFGQVAAWELIEAYAALAAKGNPEANYLGREAAAKQVISAYFDAIESALGLAKGTLWVDEQGKAFAGYAPVLAAVGSLLALMDNYIVVTNRLQRTGDQEAWAVIEAVLNEILIREQGKVREPLRKQYQPALPEQVYDAEEQMALLAQFVQHQPLEGAKRVILPSVEMVKYQDMIQRHLPDHPFVRQGEFSNAVLGSVVLARAVYNGRPISSEHLARCSRQPFLWRSFSSKLEASVLVDGIYAGHIMNSFWSDPLSDKESPESIYIRPAEADSAAISIQRRKDNVHFDITLPLSFYGQLKNSDIDVGGAIILHGVGAPGAGKRFTINGPVTLIADRVEIAADSVKLEGDIWLEGYQLISPPNLRLLRNGAKVGWGGEFARQFPWNREAATLPAPYALGPADRLSMLVAECAIRYPAGITLTLNTDFTPVRDDPQTRWTTRYFGEAFPKLIGLMHKYNLASSDQIGGAGFAKIRVRFSTNWNTFVRALEDSKQELLPQAFIDEARRAIN